MSSPTRTSFLQRAMDRAYEISDRALVELKFGVVVSVRSGSEDFVFGLSLRLQFLNAVAGYDQHLAKVAQHRLGAGRSVPGHDLGVFFRQLEQFVYTADLPVDAAAVEIVDVRIAIEEDEIAGDQHIG